MKVKIRIGGDDGSSVRIKASGSSRIELFCSEGGLTIVEGDGSVDRAARVASSRPDGRRRIAAPRATSDDGSISPAMEAVAVEAFLASADAARLGRALAAVYRAMDAVRRGKDPSDDDASG